VALNKWALETSTSTTWTRAWGTSLFRKHQLCRNVRISKIAGRLVKSAFHRTWILRSPTNRTIIGKTPCVPSLRVATKSSHIGSWLLSTLHSNRPPRLEPSRTWLAMIRRAVLSRFRIMYPVCWTLSVPCHSPIRAPSPWARDAASDCWRTAERSPLIARKRLAKRVLRERVRR